MLLMICQFNQGLHPSVRQGDRFFYEAQHVLRLVNLPHLMHDRAHVSSTASSCTQTTIAQLFQRQTNSFKGLSVVVLMRVQEDDPRLL